MIPTGRQRAGEKQAPRGGGGAGGHVASREGHLGGITSISTAVRRLCPPHPSQPHPTAPHAPDLSPVLKTSSTDQGQFGFGSRMVFHFVDTARGNLCPSQRGGHCAPGQKAGSHVDSPPPQPLHILSHRPCRCGFPKYLSRCLSTLFPELRSLPGPFSTASSLLQISPSRYSLRACPDNDDAVRGALIMFQGRLSTLRRHLVRPSQLPYVGGISFLVNEETEFRG